MDVQLQELIDKIKKDGVASAENSAATIIAEAEKKATSIVSDAENKAETIIKSAKAETERLEKASLDAIKQAGRNLLISFTDGINTELSSLVNAETEKAFSPDLLKTLIPETVKNWANKTEAEELSLLLSEKDLKALESGLLSALKEKVSSGLTIKADDSLTAGFRIGTKDGVAFYDFSSEAVAELFSAYLNPRTAEILKSVSL